MFNCLRIIFFGFLCFFNFISLSFSSEVYFNTKLKSDSSLTAGDVVELEIEVSKPALSIEEISRDTIEKLKSGPIVHGQGRILWLKTEQDHIKLGWTTYVPGKSTIPSYIFLDKTKEIGRTEEKQVEFNSVGGDKSKDDIYPPQAVGFPRWVYVVVSFFLLLLVLAIIWGVSRWIINKKNRLKQFSAAPRVLSALEEFEKKLAEIEEKNYVQKQIFKPHYFGLSEAAKKFLSKTFHFDAEDKTTRELVLEMTARQIDQNFIEEWKSLFEEMDLVKFTDQKPLPAVAGSLSDRLLKISRKCSKIIHEEEKS